MGGLTRKVQWIGRRGAPDRLVLLPEVDHGDGRFQAPVAVFAELKRPGGRPDPHQEREISRLRSFGVPVVVLDTFEAVDALLFHRGSAL